MEVLTHLMFQDGRARDAAEWYVSLVPRSRIERIVDDGAGGVTVYFALADQDFIAFDSPIQHDFDFTASVSIFVQCDDDEQVRRLFGQIATDGDVKMPVSDYGFSSCFGWATDDTECHGRSAGSIRDSLTTESERCRSGRTREP